MEVRELKKEDIGRVIEIVNRNCDEVMIKNHTKEVLEKFKLHNDQATWVKQMGWKKIFVVEEENIVIATGALANFGENDVPKYCLSNFFVSPENQNSGIGKLIFTHVLEYAKSKGIKLLHVPSSRTGYAFYRNLGFIEEKIQNDLRDEIIWMSLQIS